MLRGYGWIALVLCVLLGGAPAWGANPDAPPAGSLFVDPIASAVGDIVLVHLTSSSVQATVNGTSTTTTNSPLVSIFVSQGLQTTQGSATTWQNALTGDFAMRVTGIAPGGLMTVQGSRQFRLDGNLQTITITGVLRAQDLGSDDSVQGSRLADVVATMTGHLTTVQRFTIWDALAIAFGVGIILKLIPAL